jgi:hypothetical protein
MYWRTLWAIVAIFGWSAIHARVQPAGKAHILLDKTSFILPLSGPFVRHSNNMYRAPSASRACQLERLCLLGGLWQRIAFDPGGPTDP